MITMPACPQGGMGFQNRYLPILETNHILCALCVSVVKLSFIYQRGISFSWGMPVSVVSFWMPAASSSNRSAAS